MCFIQNFVTASSFLSFDLVSGKHNLLTLGDPIDEYTCDATNWADDDRVKLDCSVHNPSISETECLARINCCWEEVVNPDGENPPWCFFAHMEVIPETTTKEETTVSDQTTSPVSEQTTKPVTTKPITTEFTESETTVTPYNATTKPAITDETTEITSTTVDVTTTVESSASTSETQTTSFETTRPDVDTTEPKTSKPESTNPETTDSIDPEIPICFASFNAAFSTENSCIYYTIGIISGVFVFINFICLWGLIWYFACRKRVTPTPETSDDTGKVADKNSVMRNNEDTHNNFGFSVQEQNQQQRSEDEIVLQQFQNFILQQKSEQRQY